MNVRLGFNRNKWKSTAKDEYYDKPFDLSANEFNKTQREDL